MWSSLSNRATALFQHFLFFCYPVMPRGPNFFLPFYCRTVLRSLSYWIVLPGQERRGKRRRAKLALGWRLVRTLTLLKTGRRGPHSFPSSPSFPPSSIPSPTSIPPFPPSLQSAAQPSRAPAARRWAAQESTSLPALHFPRAMLKCAVLLSQAFWSVLVSLERPVVKPHQGGYVQILAHQYGGWGGGHIRPNGYAVLMRPDTTGPVVRGCQCPGQQSI